MNIENKLMTEFEEISKAYFEKEYNHIFLRIEVNKRNLNSIADISKNISNFLDTEYETDENYFLDIFSPGTEEEIEIKNLGKHINENIIIVLNKHLKEKKEFEGIIMSVDNDKIIIKWNAKGQFRKQEINIDNILKIRQSAKLKK